MLALAVILIPMFFDEPREEIPAIPVKSATQVRPVLPDYSEVVPDSDVQDRVRALEKEVDDEGYSTSTLERIGEPILLTPNEETEIWAVQAASFAQVENARNFRSQLREMGLEAFVSSARNASGTVMHRVAVGPMLKRADAEQMTNQIADQFDLSPKVVEMVP